MRLPVILRTIGLVFVALFGAAFLNAPAKGQCSQAIAGDEVGPPLGPFYAMLDWHRDGAGAPVLVGSALVVDGNSLNAGVVVRTENGWEVVGDTFPGQVYALAEYQGKLIAAGDFIKVGTTSVAHIAAWNGTAWEPLGDGTNGPIYALEIFQGELVAGGNFSKAGASSVSSVASWNGSTWRPLVTGPFVEVRSLRTFQGSLIAGGSFTSINGVPAANIASFDGTVWHALGAGLIGSGAKIYALMEYGGELIAAGQFGRAGVVGAKNVAAWNGTSWRALQGGVNGIVYALRSFEGLLYAGGFIISAGAPPVNAIEVAAWNGLTWSAAGTGDGAIGPQSNSQNYVSCFGVTGGRLVAGGRLSNSVYSGGMVSQWTGTEWVPLDGRLAGAVAEITPFRGRFVAGGDFVRIGEVRVNYVMEWDGNGWQGLGAGLRGPAKGLTEYAGKLVVSGGTPWELPAGAGSMSTWDGAHWAPLGTFDAGSANVFAEWNGQLIAAGNISPTAAVAARGIAAWDGASWHGLGSGISSATTNAAVKALCTFDGRLIAGGIFISAGGTPVDHLAGWDGSSWSHVGGGTNGNVNTMVVWNGKLIVGGSFSSAGDTPVPVLNVGAWSGGVSTKWQPMNSAFVAVKLFVYRGDLLARFTGLSNIQRWNGTSWEDFGFDAFVPIGVMAGEMAAWTTSGGTIIGAHALPRYVSGEPMLPTQPRDPLAYCGTFAEIGVIVDNVGTNTPTYQWWKGAAVLSDGPTGTGSTVSGATGPVLRIDNIGAADAGEYNVVVTNTCGTITSHSATLTPNCCPADLNGDGVVDTADFERFVVAYDLLNCADQLMPQDCPADFNRDGVVDDADFSEFVVAYDAMVCG